MHNNDKQRRFCSFEVQFTRKRWHLKQNGILSKNKQDTGNVLHLSNFSQGIVSDDFKNLINDHFHQNCLHFFKVALPLPVCQMDTHRHFYGGFMTFFFDKRFLQAMEFISKTFDKPSVVILLQKSKKVLVQTKNG